MIETTSNDATGCAKELRRTRLAGSTEGPTDRHGDDTSVSVGDRRMTETIYRFLEGVVSPANVLLMAVVVLLSATLVTAVMRLFVRVTPGVDLLRDVATFTVTVIVCYVLLLGIRGRVGDYRQQRIYELYRTLDQASTRSRGETTSHVRSWRDGLDAIRSNPQEIGYYMRTGELLENEHDYRSAITLLELGLNHFEDPPVILCSQLERYYTIAKPPNRPRMRECVKFVEF